MEEQIYTVAEAARYLRTPTDSIYRMIADGSLPAAKIRGQWRIRKADIDALFKSQKPTDDKKPP
jgi:excisionase family DNA binding protein